MRTKSHYIVGLLYFTYLKKTKQIQAGNLLTAVLLNTHYLEILTCRTLKSGVIPNSATYRHPINNNNILLISCAIFTFLNKTCIHYWTTCETRITGDFLINAPHFPQLRVDSHSGWALIDIIGWTVHRRIKDILIPLFLNFSEHLLVTVP